MSQSETSQVQPGRPGRVASGSLRARKRAETHVTLVEAALERFTARGFDATTMEDVAAAAGVAPRTAFRYFPAKEDLVFADYEAEMDRWIAAFHAAPAGTMLLDALRAATRAIVDEYLKREAFWDRVWHLMTTEPALAARAQRSQALLQGRAADTIGARMGIDPRADPRAQVVAAAAMAAVDLATRRWYASGKTLDYAAEVDAAFDRLGELDAFLQSGVPSGQ